jgi:hypothetical protein
MFWMNLLWNNPIGRTLDEFMFLGLCWMESMFRIFFPQARNLQAKDLKEGVKAVGTTVYHSMGEMGESMKDRAQDIGGAMYQKISDVKNVVSDTMGNISETASQTISQAAGKGKEMLHRVTEWDEVTNDLKALENQLNTSVGSFEKRIKSLEDEMRQQMHLHNRLSFFEETFREIAQTEDPWSQENVKKLKKSFLQAKKREEEFPTLEHQLQTRNPGAS